METIYHWADLLSRAWGLMLLVIFVMGMTKRSERDRYSQLFIIGTLASVPPLVKTTSDGSAAISAATADRASSRTALARCPKWCTLEALPNSSRRTRLTASATAGSTGVVALWSK